MKTAVKLTVFGFILLILVFILSIWGVPIKKEYSKGQCASTYDSYLFPRNVCQIVTGGHCVSTNFNLTAAKFDVARCLCETYKNNPSDGLSTNIKNICNETYCRTITETYECKYLIQGTECPYENVLPEASMLCENAEVFFSPSFID